MSETAILGIVAVLGTIGGVVIGRWIEGGQADRVLRRQAYHDFSALSIESVYQLQEVRDTIRAGQTQMPGLRPDYAREYFRSLTLVQLVAKPAVLAQGLIVSDLIRALTDAVVVDPRADVSDAQGKAIAAIYAFNDAASLELSPWWRRLRRPTT